MYTLKPEKISIFESTVENVLSFIQQDWSALWECKGKVLTVNEKLKLSPINMVTQRKVNKKKEFPKSLNASLIYHSKQWRSQMHTRHPNRQEKTGEDSRAESHQTAEEISNINANFLSH